MAHINRPSAQFLPLSQLNADDVWTGARLSNDTSDGSMDLIEVGAGHWPELGAAQKDNTQLYIIICAESFSWQNKP